MVLNRQERQNLIISFVENHPDLSLYRCAKELEKFEIGRSTCYSVGQKVRNHETINNYNSSGRKSRIMTDRKLTKFAEVAEGWTRSQRKLAAEFGISIRYCQFLLEKFNIKAWKKRDAPKSSPGQVERQQARLQVLAGNLIPVSGKKDIIEDDESYFPLAGKLNKYFLSSDPSSADPQVTLRPRSKFERRMCIWMAISRKGCSRPFYLPANCAINAHIYSTECIKKRLVPFIRKNYPNRRYIFWPDGASCHYAAVTMATIHEFGINIVGKEDNPPNVPQLRSIERFWAHLKAKVYENGWEAENFTQLKRRITTKIKEFDSDYFERLFAHEKVRIAAAAESGPLSVISNRIHRN